jgi:hypothetical protein
MYNGYNFGRQFNACADRANATLTYSLNGGFYPTFQDIQNSVSGVPLLTMNALSRGNVFDDTQDILDYLQTQYDMMVFQWLGAVSLLFNWDSTRFAVEGNFYIDEMLKCTVDPIYHYSNTNAALTFEAYDVCRVQ